jgi:hypothetical protein
MAAAYGTAAYGCANAVWTDNGRRNECGDCAIQNRCVLEKDSMGIYTAV